MEDDAVLDGLEAWADYADVPEVVEGVGAQDGDHYAVVEVGGWQDVDLDAADFAADGFDVVHTEIEGAVTLIQHDVCSLIVVSHQIPRNQCQNIQSIR